MHLDSFWRLGSCFLQTLSGNHGKYDSQSCKRTFLGGNFDESRQKIMEQTHVLYIFPTWSISIPIGWIRYPLGNVFLVTHSHQGWYVATLRVEVRCAQEIVDEITNGAVDDFYKCSWLFFPGQSFHICWYSTSFTEKLRFSDLNKGNYHVAMILTCGALQQPHPTDLKLGASFWRLCTPRISFVLN